MATTQTNQGFRADFDHVFPSFGKFPISRHGLQLILFSTFHTVSNNPPIRRYIHFGIGICLITPIFLDLKCRHFVPRRNVFNAVTLFWSFQDLQLWPGGPVFSQNRQKVGSHYNYFFTRQQKTRQAYTAATPDTTCIFPLNTYHFPSIVIISSTFRSQLSLFEITLTKFM